MKKIILLLIPFIMTGCFNGALVGNLNNTCTKTEISNNLKEDITYYIEFRAGKINKITLTNQFSTINNEDISYITSSINSYKLAYQNEVGVMVKTNDNSIIYEFKLSDISEDVKKEFGLTTDYNNQIKKLKESGFECK